MLPEGRVDVPGLLYGSVGLGLSVVLQWLGAYQRADSWLFGLLHEPLFRGGTPDLPAFELSIFFGAVFCYGIAYAVLDSALIWRKVVLGVTAVALSLAMIPAFAVWNVYFSPFLQVVGVFWSWFCVVLYTQHHQMPCDPVHVDVRISAPEPELLQPMGAAEKTNKVQKTSAKKPKQKKKKKTSADDKYKPKSG